MHVWNTFSFYMDILCFHVEFMMVSISQVLLRLPAFSMS